jgi:hypothetical protein
MPDAAQGLIGGDSASLAEALPLCVNTADETLFGNMRAAVAAGYPLIAGVRPHNEVALLVGGGPSLEETRDEIAKLDEVGAHVFALNGAGIWLQENGIIPDAVIVLDARPHNARFVANISRLAVLYLATQCDPAVFEAGKNNEIVAWHPNMDGTSGVIEPRYRETIFIGSGTSVGMRAMRLVHVLGYRTVHLFGYDSSYRDDEAHAYPQAENDSDLPRECFCGGRRFVSTGWMIRQADDFKHIAAGLMTEGMTIHVHGDGLLPEVARQGNALPMVTLSTVAGCERDASRAVYDLGKCPASWDFLNWLVMAEMGRRLAGRNGPLRVAFRPGPNGGFRDDGLPLSVAERQGMFNNVMRPALALVRAIEDATAADGVEYEGYSPRPISDAARVGQDVPVLHAPGSYLAAVDRWLYRDLWKFAEDGNGKGLVTITLREAEHWPHRNSAIGEWLRFASDLDKQGYRVVFVRDTAKADIPLEFATCPRASWDLLYRAALYERAVCNLMVANGPLALLVYGQKPWLLFKMLNQPTDPEYNPASEEWYRTFVGIEPRGQYPWSSKLQRIVWDTDSYSAIRAAWDEIEGLL